MNYSSRDRAISRWRRVAGPLMGVSSLYMTRGSDVWVLPLFGDRKPVSAGPNAVSPKHQQCSLPMDGGSHTRATRTASRTSTCNRFPRPGAKFQVSRDGGSHPVWRADGKELFYLDADGNMMAVPIEATSRFDPGVPQSLFSTSTPTADRRQGLGSVATAYAVTKDGQRFLVGATSRQSRVAPLTVLLNWMSCDQEGTVKGCGRSNRRALAYDGPGALVAAESFRPDVVLLDIGLPLMNGFDVCREIRERPWGRRSCRGSDGWGGCRSRLFQGGRLRPPSRETGRARDGPRIAQRGLTSPDPRPTRCVGERSR